MKIQKTPVEQIIPYSKNAKKHHKKQIQQIADSINEFGFNQPIVVDENNIVIVGHGRLEAAKLLKLQEVPTLTANLTEEQAKAYRLADNKLNESEWDIDLVIEELRDLNLQGFNIELTGFDSDLILSDNFLPEYSNKIDSPSYQPIGQKPTINELYDTTKTLELIKEIDSSNLHETDKEFLRCAAQRHIVFNYSNIAEYYAHSDRDTQQLMEKSALVIIDFKNALENGYIELSKIIESQYLSEYEDGY